MSVRGAQSAGCAMRTHWENQQPQRWGNSCISSSTEEAKGIDLAKRDGGGGRRHLRRELCACDKGEAAAYTEAAAAAGGSSQSTGQIRK
jgi:hypothetical protein